MTAPRTIVEIHALQNVPPSNINRDDTGAPKSAVYGGVNRARVSSQAWKRAMRKHFGETLDPSELGVRTKRVAELLAERITARDASIAGDDALKLAVPVLFAATGATIAAPKRKQEKVRENGEAAPAPEAGYLLFLSARQLDGLAELAVKGSADIEGFLKDKETKNEAKKIANSRHSVDIALFGRMVADSADINVDAAVQVAHALSVHRAEIESDYYTAVDDRNKKVETGAGMIGSIDFNSATLYRFAAIDANLLHANLAAGWDATEAQATPVRRAVEVFLDSFIASLPTGKLNTFGNHTLPDAALVKIRGDRPISLVSAFEEPVVADERGGHMQKACEQLAAYSDEVEKKFGDGHTQTWVLRLGSATAPLSGLGTDAASLRELISSVGEAVAARMKGSQ